MWEKTTLIPIQEQINLINSVLANFMKNHPELGYTSNNVLTNLNNDTIKNYVGIAISYTISELSESDKINKDLNTTKKVK